VESLKKIINGIAVRNVERGSPAYRSGMRRGDLVLSVNGEPVADELDFLFFCTAETNPVKLIRRGRPLSISLVRDSESSWGIAFSAPPIRRCGNRCIFCFIDQMPRGLRGPLYVKDEDFRHSFVYGNYVTLSTARQPDLDDIARLNLSPLYVSVHATEPGVRAAMLRNHRAPDILAQLRWLAGRGIRLHTQIVVCPGYNDGEVLDRSLRDLLRLGKNLLSVAVVPVGLTRFRTFPLKPVDREDAASIVDAVTLLSDRMAEHEAKRRVFLADEMFIKAERPVPPLPYYEDFPQIENGVGLVRMLLDDWRRVRRRIGPSIPGVNRPGRKVLVLTGESAFRFVKPIADKLSARFSELRVEVVAVRNEFFGHSVTVAGLLTARDIVGTARSNGTGWSAVVAPQAIFNYRGFTLDGASRPTLQKRLGTRFYCASNASDLLDIFRTIHSL
jgi:putative radical SAM enzyme (TIGR03279 family)